MSADPVFKVIDALACGRHGPGVRMCLADRLADLGVDPDMLADDLREDLAVGRSARKLGLAVDGLWWCGCGDLVDLDDKDWATHGCCANCVAIEAPAGGAP